jgi:hypothetical protein
MFLRDHGLEEVVAAVPTVDGGPWRPLAGFTVLLYRGWRARRRWSKA